MKTMSIYRDIRAILPFNLKTKLSGLRSYAGDSLDFLNKSLAIAKREDLDKSQKKEAIKELSVKVEDLSILLFTYALYQEFVIGDRMIKQTVETFEGLDIPSFKIGRTEFSRNSEYYNLGATFAENLFECIEDNSLKNLFRTNPRLYEIANWYKGVQS
jgi:hypothetical protein